MIWHQYVSISIWSNLKIDGNSPYNWSNLKIDGRVKLQIYNKIHLIINQSMGKVWKSILDWKF